LVFLKLARTGSTEYKSQRAKYINDSSKSPLIAQADDKKALIRLARKWSEDSVSSRDACISRLRHRPFFNQTALLQRLPQMRDFSANIPQSKHPDEKYSKPFYGCQTIKALNN